MISGSKERRIAWYLPKGCSHVACNHVTPGTEEQFVGIPYQWVDDHSEPFIEVRLRGFVVRTINALDLARIGFAIVPDDGDQTKGDPNEQ